MKRLSIRLFVILCLGGNLLSCSTFGAKEKTLIAMGSAAIVSGTIDASTRPSGSSFDSRSVAVGGVAAALTGVVALYLFDQDKVIQEKDRRIDSLSAELQVYRGNEGMGEMVKGAGLERDLPPKYRGLVKPGSWSIYQIDQWVSAGDHTLIHQDKMIQIENPRFDVAKAVGVSTDRAHDEPEQKNNKNNQMNKKGEENESN